MENKSYSIIHHTIKKIYGNAPECIFCDKIAKRFEWANVSGVYTIDIEDYLPMCPSCHRKFDIDDTTRAKNRANAIKNSVLMDRNVIMQRRVESTGSAGNKITFESIAKASDYTGVSRTAIVNCLQNRTKTSGGLRWEYL